jgi:signal transduction histidine kinase
MDISSIARKSQANASVLAQTDQCREMLDKLSQEIRTTSYLLHPPLLDELGLASALGWYVDGLNLTLEVPEAIPRLESNLELTAFKVVQECLTNVYRHSGSETACVGVTVEDGKLTVIVADKGKGMPKAKSATARTQGSGVGMLGMRERLREVDGTMDIRSNEAGTRIRFDFPLSLAR